mgnify:CR=1 FL=1
MIESLYTLFERASTWFGDHPSVSAVVLAWLFGICVTQGFKRFYPVEWSVTRVKRVSQTIAIVSASTFAFRLWPAGAPRAFEFSLLAGMACPQLYTALKLLLPNVMRRWGWSCIQERKERAQEGGGG